MDACAEINNTVGEEDDEGQDRVDDQDRSGVEDSYGVSLAAGDMISPRGSVHSDNSGHGSQTAIANDVEVNHRDEESPRQSAKDADETPTATTLTKPKQTSTTKTGNSRAKNGSKCADKKIPYEIGQK